MNDMNANCVDRERIFMDGSAAEWAALEAHAATCVECGEELRIWKGMSTAAGELRQEWETPYTAVALLVLVVVTGTAWRIIHDRRGPDSQVFLKNSAVNQVERAEADYRKAIDKLDAETKPQLEAAATPLMASYREKLLVLDNAIDELRAETGRNPANAHLRRQLLAMYQEKQETLQEILETKR